jgi:hypothetical protein
MTASEALPYLQVFTPLTFTSHIDTLPRAPDAKPNAPVLQKHTITAVSTAPRGLFAARVEMTVNTKTMAVTRLAVPKLDPAAAAELTPFVEKIVSSGRRSSALSNNVSVLCWAMGEWLRLATQRARVWCVLEREVVADESVLSETVKRIRMRAAQRKRRRKRGQQRQQQRQQQQQRTEDEDDSSEPEDEEDADGDGKGLETRDLLSYMGRTSMDFDIPVLGGDEGSMLRVQWRVEFDWTGEGRNKIGVLVGVPGKCKFFLSSLSTASAVTAAAACGRDGGLFLLT